MKTSGHYYRNFIIAGLLTTLGLTVGTTTYLSAVDYATTARGVDVYVLTPSTAPVVGTPMAADIIITNDGTPLNAMEAEIYFDATRFAVTDLTFNTSLCDTRFIIDRVIDNTAGRVHMSCGTPNPFTGHVTVFGTITAIPLQAGISKLTFGEATHVHVHDGLGTEIVRDTYDTTLNIASEA